MPTKRTFRTRAPRPEISEVALHFLSDGLFRLPPDSMREEIAWKYFHEPPATWDEYKEIILGAWIRERPGTRPAAWWLSDAPEPTRRRLGGIGDPVHEHLPAYAPSYVCGIPAVFVDEVDAAYYNGRSVDIHGNAIRSGHTEGEFEGKPIDPNDPPAYESQAAYLRRHRLLRPDEKRRLKSEDFDEWERVTP